MTSNGPVSDTTPRRRADTDPGRVGALVLVGNGARLDSLRGGRVVTVADGADIGRRPTARDGRLVVTLTDHTVSGLHARIDRRSEGGGYTVEDCGSTNGTLLDGGSFQGRAPLRDGSVLFFGSQVAVFRVVSAAEITAIEDDAGAPFAPVATQSPGVAMVSAELRRRARSSTEVMLVGESGVGKEVFATAVHAASGRRGRFVSVNCAALPRDQLESELFGGAQPGADRSRKEGFIAAAQGGTLFLEELGEMPIDVQSKLVRFLRDRAFFPVGSSRAVAADVLVVAASSTASSIPDALVDRLGARPIRIPPLRERLEDMGHLVARFLADAGAERPFEPEAFQALLLYEWSQNLRELRKVVAQAAVFSDGEERIGFDHLPTAILDALEGAGVADDVQGAAADRATEDTAKMTGAFHPAAGTTRVRRPLPSADELMELMRLYHGNVSHVARHLRRQWTVIWQSLRRNGIDPSAFRAPGTRDRPS